VNLRAAVCGFMMEMRAVPEHQVLPIRGFRVQQRRQPVVHRASLSPMLVLRAVVSQHPEIAARERVCRAIVGSRNDHVAPVVATLVEDRPAAAGDQILQPDDFVLLGVPARARRVRKFGRAGKPRLF
jgi:hypothetical protein